MQYLQLVYLAEQKVKCIPQAACPAYAADPPRLAVAGPRCVSAHLCARSENGVVLVTDGPFIETKEYLAGSQ